MKKYSVETIVGIFVAAGLLCMGYMTAKLGNVSFFGEDPHVLYSFPRTSYVLDDEPHGPPNCCVRNIPWIQGSQAAVDV